MNADQMLVSELNRMSEFSDIIDGYLRIENIDILTKNRLIDRINEFSVYCGCGNIGDRWIETDQETGFSLVVSGILMVKKHILPVLLVIPGKVIN